MISVGIISNGIPEEIREGKKAVGTMPAAGASNRVIMGVYLRRLVVTTGIRAVLEVLGCIGYGQWERLVLITGEFTISLWPVIPVTSLVLIFGYLNIRVQIRKNLRKSVVENIRELG